MRLLIGGGCFVIAIFSVLPVPVPAWSIIGLLATEWGHLVALIGLTTLWPGWRHTANGKLAGSLALVAVALTLAPMMRAIPVARDLPARLEGAFGPTPPTAFCGGAPRASGLLIADALFGIRPREAVAEELTYAIRDGLALKISIKRSMAEGCPRPSPGVIVVEGPTWDTGADPTFNALGNYLAQRGYGVVTIGYRPAPRWSHPDQVDDVSAAVAYVKQSAARLAIDPDRLVLLGRSIQGHLALNVAYRQGVVRGVIAFYPPADLREAYDASDARTSTRQMLSDYLGGTPAEVPAVYDRASAVSLAGPGSPPTLLIHGGSDDTFALDESIRLDERLERAGVRHLLVRMPWAKHGCDRNLAGPCGQISTYAIERFLAAILRR